MMFLASPMVAMSLVADIGDGVLFSPPLEKTKEIMINCLKEIVENTQQFPRIEKEIFPDYKDSDYFLLEVTWQEDYVQQLGKCHSRKLLRSCNELLSNFPEKKTKSSGQFDQSFANFAQFTVFAKLCSNY